MLFVIPLTVCIVSAPLGVYAAFVALRLAVWERLVELSKFNDARTR